MVVDQTCQKTRELPSVSDAVVDGCPGETHAARPTVLQPCCRLVEQRLPMAGGLPLSLRPSHNVEARVQRFVAPQCLHYDLQCSTDSGGIKAQLAELQKSDKTPGSSYSACWHSAGSRNGHPVTLSSSTVTATTLPSPTTPQSHPTPHAVPQPHQRVGWCGAHLPPS